jgi:hypothetical protein
MARRRNLLHLQLSSSDVYLFFDGWRAAAPKLIKRCLNGRINLGGFDFSGILLLTMEAAKTLIIVVLIHAGHQRSTT